jgi:hypothetical protein
MCVGWIHMTGECRVTTQNERDVVFFKGNEKSELQRGEGLK